MWFERFAATVDVHAGQPALATPDGTLTYRHLRERAEQWHREHQGETGRVIVVHTDTVQTLVTLIGAWQARRPVALLQASLPPATLQALQVRLNQPVPRREGGDPQDQEALVLATSGTTGLPKLVAHSHRSIAAMADHILEWYGLPAGMRTLVAVPLAMVTGLAQVLVALSAGWTAYVYPERSPVPLLLEALRRHEIQVLPGSAAFHRVLMGYAAGHVFPSVVHVRGSGEPMEPALIAQLRAAFPNARHYHAYGATDAGWRIAALPNSDPRVAEGGAGVPLPDYDIRIRPVSGMPAGWGELLVRGEMVCLGYLSESGAYEGLSPDGWLPTRDVAHIAADGCLYLHGRMDVLFKSGGRWVNPAEVERVLARLPGVAEARCFPAPHPLLRHVPIVEVAAAPGHALQPEDLRAACASYLEPHQVPREFRIVAEVSHGASGKKQRA